jgi:hypothetical protein
MLVSSTNQQVTLERIHFATLELSDLGVRLQQPMNGPPFEPDALGKALGSATGWRAEADLDALGQEDLQDCVHQRGLAYAGSASDHQHLAGHGQSKCLLLARRQGQVRSPSTQGTALLTSTAGHGG